MIASLRGTVHRLDPTEAVLDVGGVGYRVTVPIDTWETLAEGESAMLWTSTYVREDRLDLFGFSDRAGRTLFETLLTVPGVGPKLGLELCAVPRRILKQAIAEGDPSLLMAVRGIGRKTAEKLLIELRQMEERRPGIFGTGSEELRRSEYDQDAVAALSGLGYDTSAVLEALRKLPSEVRTTEERVAAALKNL